MQTIVTRSIKAPLATVFETVADIHNFQRVIPNIVRVDMLSDVRSGVGTRFRETREMNGREVSTELEVTEYVPNDHVRIVSDTQGTIWDTTFRVRDEGGATELVMEMDARAHKILPRLINPLIRGVVQRAVEKDMDAVKAHCEGSQA